MPSPRAEAEKIARKIIHNWGDDVRGSLGAFVSKNDEAILTESGAAGGFHLQAADQGSRGIVRKCASRS
jgi:hypothetical protein